MKNKEFNRLNQQTFAIFLKYSELNKQSLELQIEYHTKVLEKSKFAKDNGINFKVMANNEIDNSINSNDYIEMCCTISIKELQRQLDELIETLEALKADPRNIFKYE